MFLLSGLFYLTHEVIDRYREHERFISALISLNGSVSSEPGGPDWLRDILPRSQYRIYDTYRSITIPYPAANVSLQETKRSIAEIGRCPRYLGQVHRIAIKFQEFTDDDLSFLKHAKNLERLNLDRTSITDDFGKYLTHLERLKYLSCENTSLTSAALPQFQQMPNVHGINLRGTKIPPQEQTRLHKFLAKKHNLPYQPVRIRLLDEMLKNSGINVPPIDE